MTMTRRRLLLFPLPVVLVLLGVGLWMIADANARAIRLGMTRDEVEARLGATYLNVTSWWGITTLVWTEHAILIDFDRNGIVVNVVHAEVSWHDRVRRWLGL
jgi:hypothetical protein